MIMDLVMALLYLRTKLRFLYQDYLRETLRRTTFRKTVSIL
ncbi:hypothetical protein AM1_C0286 (plasmid) [Acaryochloris marina MBIC11017]|uniref:Uncharacterized protein n=1 Tax=Acaryochloris marina (strain MBIC 11017) TaxID=329726 RepID=A8ZN17_ACAM1|nr:hypothetical protein AM1_C0286 [Acaryochloris marina MBIC11017]